VIGGESFYKYSGSRYDPAANDSVLQQFSGTARFVTALVGWQFSGGGTTAKVFGGYEYANHAIVPFDPETKIQGAAGGITGVTEIWHNWTAHAWTSLDLAASGAHRSYSAQVRFGQRFGEGWSLGPEGSVIGHTETTLQRLGAFVRFENLVHEFTVSGGATRARGDLPSGYAAAQYLRRF
jgi:hypothetical protein